MDSVEPPGFVSPLTRLPDLMFETLVHKCAVGLFYGKLLPDCNVCSGGSGSFFNGVRRLEPCHVDHRGFARSLFGSVLRNDDMAVG